MTPAVPAPPVIADVISELRAQLAAQNVIIADLHRDLAAQAAQVRTLMAEVEKEKNKANAVLAAQGLLPGDVPKGHVSGYPELGGNSGETPHQKYQRLLLEDPAAAGEYYQANADAILASRKQ